MVKSLQSGFILSTLLLWTSQQVGTTFGEFTSVREDNSEIKACRVFPSQIESQLAILAKHLERAATLKGKLIGATLTRAAIDTTIPAPAPVLSEAGVTAPASPAAPSATDAVYSGGEGSGGSEATADFSASLQLEAAADRLAAQISELHATIQQMQRQQALNQSIWQELQQELAAAAAVFHGLLTSLIELEPNCAELTQTTLLDRLEDLLKGSGLSGPLRGTLQEMLGYLRSIHASAPALSVDGFAAVAFTGPLADGDSALNNPVDGEALAYFESVQASLESAIAGLSAELSSLEAQRSRLLAEAEAQRLAEIERLKRLAEAKAQEEAGQAEDPANPDENADPSGGEPQQPGEEPPAPDEPTDGEVPPTEGDSDNGAVQPPAEDDNAAEEDAKDGNEADEEASSDEPPPAPGDAAGHGPSPEQPDPPVGEDPVALPPDAPTSGDPPTLEPPLPPVQPDPLEDLVLTKPEEELPIHDENTADDEDEEESEGDNEEGNQPNEVDPSRTAIPSPANSSEVGE